MSLNKLTLNRLGTWVTIASRELFSYNAPWRWIIGAEMQLRTRKCGQRGGGGSSKVEPYITMKNLNPNITKVEYAVRGPIVNRALAIEEELRKGASKPFKTVIKANIGDAHAMGQKPITFIRQVLACCSHPPIMKQMKFPSDVVARAKRLLAGCGGGSVGAYTASPGIEVIRKDIAKYIEKRDGHPCNWQDISIGSGASGVIKTCMELFCNNPGGKPSGIMIPIPQYPLYTALISGFGLEKVPYYLDEDNKWGLDINELQRSIKKGREHSDVRALIVINPGNPTGQVLTRKNIEGVIKFAYENKLFIFADEVYQHNIYDDCSDFFSFKKVMCELGAPYKHMNMASFMSISKGYMGCCGIRGGWMELINTDKDVEAQYQKCISASLCSASLGQIIADCVAMPPKEGEESYELWLKEKNQVICSLSERATLIANTFNKMPGFKCNPVQGAMYAFPKFELPKKAIEAAKQKGVPPDVFYALELLEATGVCIVAGSGFGQIPGTHHFRTTILPPKPLLEEMLKIFAKFHTDFTKKYS